MFTDVFKERTASISNEEQDCADKANTSYITSENIYKTTCHKTVFSTDVFKERTASISNEEQDCADEANTSYKTSENIYNITCHKTVFFASRHDNLTSKKDPYILWIPKFHDSVSNSQPLVTIQSKINSVHILKPCFLRALIKLSSHLCLVFPRGFFPSGLTVRCY
jgi:hypothetical protein